MLREYSVAEAYDYFTAQIEVETANISRWSDNLNREHDQRERHVLLSYIIRADNNRESLKAARDALHIMARRVTRFH